MAHYIDKDALVAEIKRIEYETNYEPFTDEVLGKRYVCRSLLSFFNTLEVKEVDFETAFAASIDHFDEKNSYGQWSESDLREFAEHFFELGLKAQKGE